MAKAASLADTLGKHLESAVCLDQYNEPKVLPCLHSFCKRCLQGLLTLEEAVCKIICPTCRSSAEVSSGVILDYAVVICLMHCTVYVSLSIGNIFADVNVLIFY